MKSSPATQLRSISKNALKSGFALFGLEVESKENRQAALPELYQRLEEALYAKTTGLSASYDCPLESCVIQTGFSFSEKKFHPFVEALKRIHNGLEAPVYEGSFLEHYYHAWTPSDGNEVYAGFGNAPETLHSVPSFTVHAPWMEAEPTARQILMERTIAYENAAADEPDLPPAAGYGLHGPVTRRKGQLEFLRLLETYESIQGRGFDRTISKEDVSAIGIERNGEFRFCIMHGQHRMAAMSALGYRKVPVNITKVVHFNEIEHWPQVYRGTWTVQQAQDYINHLFDFDSNRWAHQQGLLSGAKVEETFVEPKLVSQAR